MDGSKTQSNDTTDNVKAFVVVHHLLEACGGEKREENFKFMYVEKRFVSVKNI